MRYAVIASSSGPLADYGFAPFDHATKHRIFTTEGVHFRRQHSKADLIVLCESEKEARRICNALDGAKGEYLRRCKAANAALVKATKRLIEEARERAGQIEMEVETAISTVPERPPGPFQPQIIPGGKAQK